MIDKDWIYSFPELEGLYRMTNRQALMYLAIADKLTYRGSWSEMDDSEFDALQNDVAGAINALMKGEDDMDYAILAHSNTTTVAVQSGISAMNNMTVVADNAGWALQGTALLAPPAGIYRLSSNLILVPTTSNYKMQHGWAVNDIVRLLGDQTVMVGQYETMVLSRIVELDASYVCEPRSRVFPGGVAATLFANSTHTFYTVEKLA